jgi:hypothetical protein
MILPGDFACVHTLGEVGNLITLGERLNGDKFSQWDHAEIYVGMADIQNPYGYTFGAYPGGARMVPLRKDQLSLDNPDYLWSTGKIPLTLGQRGAIVAECMKLKGVPYGFTDYLALAMHRFHIPFPGLKAFIGKSMICSQLVDYAYAQCGVHLFTDGRWPGYVTPADLAARIEAP